MTDATEKGFEELKQEIEKTLENGQYKIELIRRTLTEKAKLRRTYTVLILVDPARFGEIKHKVFVTKNTLYSHLYSLIELGLVRQISIMDLWNREGLGKEEQEVINKFRKWTKTMAEGQIKYFAAKTHYFLLTDLGRDQGIIRWALKLEKEQRSNDI